MYYDLSDALDRQKFKLRVNQLFERKKKVELKEKSFTRSLNQNSYLHLILSWYGLETGYTLEEVKQDIFKRDICCDIFLVIKGDRGVFRSTSDLDTKEMTIAIEMFRNHASKDLGIYLPEPNEDQEIASMQEQLHRYGNRQYI